MSWTAPSGTPATFEAVLSRRPELLRRYRDFYASIWREGLVPRRILELTRLRIAAIHDCEQEWALRDPAAGVGDAELDALRRGAVAGFAAAEQAALALAERMPFSHARITDAEVARARDALGAAGTVSLLTALAFFDVSCRLRIVLEVEAEPGPLTDPPLRDGVLI